MLKVLDRKKKEKRVKPGRFPSTQAPWIYPQIEVVDAEPVALDSQSRTHKWSNPPTAARKSSDKSGAMLKVLDKKENYGLVLPLSRC